MNEFPTVAKPAASEVAPAVRVLRWLAGVLQLASIAMIFAPWLSSFATRQFGLEHPLPEGWVRFAGVMLFLVTSAARLLLPGAGPRRHRSERLFSEVAGATGGTFAMERRRPGAAGWNGGPVARWTLQDIAVTMAEASKNKGEATTRFAAEFTAAKELSFSVLPKNLLSKTLTSPRFVAMIQASVARSSAEFTDEQRAEAVKAIGIYSGTGVSLGHPLLDEKIIVKSNDADLARYVLTGGGVAERMSALNELRRGWALSLFCAERGAASTLSLDLPRREPRPEVLRAAKDLFESLLGSLKQNGVVEAAEPLRQYR